MAKKTFKSFEDFGRDFRNGKKDDEKITDKFVKEMLGEDVFEREGNNKEKKGENDFKNEGIAAKSLGAAAMNKDSIDSFDNLSKENGGKISESKKNITEDDAETEKDKKEAVSNQEEKKLNVSAKKDAEKSKAKKTYAYDEAKRLQGELSLAERRLEAAKKDGSKKAEEYWGEKKMFFKGELEKVNLKISEIEEGAKNKIEDKKTKIIDKEIKAPETLLDNKLKSPDIELKKIKSQLDLLGKKLVYFKKKIEKTKDEKEKADYEEKAELIKEKREGLKILRDELAERIKKEKISKKEQIKLRRPQLAADIAESDKILTNNNAPEDAKEFIFKQKEMAAREKIEADRKKEEKSDLLKSAIDIAMEKTQKYSDKSEEENLPEAELIEEVGSVEKNVLSPMEITSEDIEKLLEVEGHPLSIGESLGSMKLGQEIEKKVQEEAREIKKEIEKMPEQERKKIALGIRNAGFFVQEYKSKILANICDKFGGSENSISRFFSALAETYRKDEKLAVKHIEERETKGGVIKKAQNAGYLWGNIVKFGRPVAEIFGFAAGSPLRYWAIPAFAFLSRGGSALKETRLGNQMLKKEMMFHDANEAADVAWKIYEIAKLKSKDGKVNKEDLKKAYDENLPSDLLERLKKSEPGTAGSILGGIAQKIFKKEIELSVKHGKFSKASYTERLKDFDRMITQFGAVDALAMAAKHMEVGGKVGVAAVSVETAYILMKRLPEIMSNLGSFVHRPESEIILNIKKPVFEVKSLTDREGARYLEDLPKINTKEKIAALSQEILQNYQDKLATVKSEEGIWHVVYRQLEDQLKDNPVKFGLKQEDMKNASKIKEILNRETGKLLVEQGYIKADGTEAIILKPGIKVLLGQDDKIRVDEKNISWKKPQIVEKIISISDKENAQRVLHSFEAKSLADKERLIHLYDADIRAMEDNLANKGLGSAKEIERLRELKGILVQSQKFAVDKKTFNEYLGFLEGQIGLRDKDYESVKNIKVGEFLNKNLDKKGLLGFFGFKNFKLELAKILETYNLSESDKTFLTIDQAIKSKISADKVL